MLLLKFYNGFNCNFCGFLLWKVVNTGADAWEYDGSASMLHGQPERVGVAIGEQMGFVTFATMPDWSYCMNDVLGFEVEPRRYLGFPCAATVECAAIIQQFLPRSAVYGAINATASQQRFVGGIHNGIGLQLGDVPLIIEISMVCCFSQ